MNNQIIERLHTQDCLEKAFSMDKESHPCRAEAAMAHFYCTQKCDAAHQKRMRKRLLDEAYQRLNYHLAIIKSEHILVTGSYVGGILSEIEQVKIQIHKMLSYEKKCLSSHSAQSGLCLFGTPQCAVHAERISEISLEASNEK